MSETSTTTPPQVMDEVIERHFAAEAVHDMEAILATLTEDCEHDVVGWPSGVSHGYDELRPFYEQLFADFEARDVRPVRRYHGEDLLVDEVVYDGVAIGRPFGLEGRNRPVSFRLLHICEFKEGRISRENIWLDFATIAQQLAD